MSPRRITVPGECAADAFTEPASVSNELALRVPPRGGPAHTAVALARLGTPARCLARLSDDVFGRLFRAHPKASGVDLSCAVTAAEPGTPAVAEPAARGRASSCPGPGRVLPFTAELLPHLGARGLIGGRLTGLGPSVADWPGLRPDPVAEACRFAARAAALTCSVAGPDPPWQNRSAQLATAGGA